jgi:hypothetical protein
VIVSERIKQNSESPVGKNSLAPPITSESIVPTKTAEDFDESVSDSVSTLSSDTIPLQPLATLSRLRPEQESEFFAELYTALAIGFRMWEDRVGWDKADNYKLLQWNDRLINLPAIQERHVVMGRRQDGGFWSGNFVLAGSDSVVVQLDTTIGLLPAVEIGWIRDFECRYGAMLFFARDKKVYYMDTEGDCGEDEQGNDIYWGHGPYDLRNFGTSHELNP